MSLTGRIHSVESYGTVDGPGIRFVIFTQGCPLRCVHCDEPDCCHSSASFEVTADELVQEVQKYTSYMQLSEGGVTIGGGEPLLQPYFVREIFKRCKKLGIHTALDTSGYADLNVAKAVLEYVDLVLLDIKSFDPVTYLKVTSVPIFPTLLVAKYLSEINKPTWLRFVLVPNLTDAPQNVDKLASFAAKLGNIERVEVLPFHKMGEYKGEELGYDYHLKDTAPPTPEVIKRTVDIFKSYGLKVQ